MISYLTTDAGNVNNDCNFGGIAKLWQIAKENVDITYDATNNTIITAMTAKASAKLHRVYFLPDSADYISDITKEGTDVFYKQTLNFTLIGKDPVTVMAQKQLDLAGGYLFVAELETGELVVLGGSGRGLVSEKSTSGAKSGANGIVFAMSGKAHAPQHSISEAIVSALLAV